MSGDMFIRDFTHMCRHFFIHIDEGAMQMSEDPHQLERKSSLYFIYFDDLLVKSYISSLFLCETSYTMHYLSHITPWQCKGPYPHLTPSQGHPPQGPGSPRRRERGTPLQLLSWMSETRAKFKNDMLYGLFFKRNQVPFILCCLKTKNCV